MQVYLDESGDLGWTLDKPYGIGGSSRFLTLAFLFVPANKAHLTKRLVRKLYAKYGWDPKEERKAAMLTMRQKLEFCRRAKQLACGTPGISLRTITVKKENVQEHIRTDPNKLYNYMVKLAANELLSKYPEVRLIYDERSIKVKSGNSMADYLQTDLWFSLGTSTRLTCIPEVSSRSLNLLFVDYLANCVWRAYEFGDSALLNTLQPAIYTKKLYF